MGEKAVGTARVQISVPKNIRDAMLTISQEGPSVNWSKVASLAFAEKCRELGFEVKTESATVNVLVKIISQLRVDELKDLLELIREMTKQR